jgi:hypothetical protein
MSDATSVLFGLEQEFSVVEVRRVDAAAVKVIIEQAARDGPCPECGVFSGTVKDGNASHAIFWAGVARLPTRCW